MKKSFATIILALLLVQIAIAQTNNASNLIDLNKIKNSSITEKEIQIDENLSELLNTILGLKKPIFLSILIITILIWIGLFILFLNMSKLLPYGEKKLFTFLTSFIILLIIGNQGILNNIALMIYSTSNILPLFNKLSSGAVIFSIMLLTIIIVILLKLSSYVKEKEKLDNAKVVGEKLAKDSGYRSKIISKD